MRGFSEAVSVVKDEAQEVESIEARNARLGVDVKFDKNQHASVLTFPWNFPATIERYAKQPTPSGLWENWTKYTASEHSFNILFREFHQYVALPDWQGIEKICEPRLADAVNQAVHRIRLQGLSLEMANLTVEQPSIKTLKVEIHHGLNVTRSLNGSESDYNISESTFLGAPTTYYTPVNDNREIFDNLDSSRNPYCIAVTCLIDSPMKLYVQNQNYSQILFGSNDRELVQNVVRFEANLKWSDLLKVGQPENKPGYKWRITDFNDLMKTNAYF